METIFAVASGAGRAAIAVMRLSGPAVPSLLPQITSRAGTLLAQPRRLLLCNLVHGNEPIDRILAVYFAPGASFTGEPSAELHLHGSPAVLEAASRCLRTHGLRMARPGEFSQRAMANGRLSLPQVESLEDLVAAQTEKQRKQALSGLHGTRLQSQLTSWRTQLLACMAHIEASIDFSEEDEHIDGAILPRLQSLTATMTVQLATDRRASELVRHGLRVVIAGPPNAGKSSLLNRLAGRRAAIVSPIAGTTRDLLHVEMLVEGLQVRLTDTAGLRAETSDPLEHEGIGMAKEAISAADLVLYLDPDPTAPSQDLDGMDKNRLLRIQSKADLSSCPASEAWQLSTVNDTVYESFYSRLIDHLRKIIAEGAGGEPPLLTHSRHHDCVQRTLDSIQRAIDALPDDVVGVAEALRRATIILGEISGVTPIDSEEILSKLFSSFCIGK
jgi:tRNA modification GTPase